MDAHLQYTEDYAEVIERKLYLSNMAFAENLSVLSSLKINRVISCYESEMSNESDDFVDYIHFQIRDDWTFDIFPFFDKAFDVIEESMNKNERVLVHCRHGFSRSPAIVISYLMRKNNISLEEAHSLVKKKKSTIIPNKGFLQCLLKYENALAKKNKKKEQSEDSDEKEGGEEVVREMVVDDGKVDERFKVEEVI